LPCFSTGTFTMASAGPDMQFHMVQVRNTFLEVQTSEDVGPKSLRPRRSKSWSGSSSSNSCHENSSGDAEKEQWFSVTVSGQAHHSVFDENSSSSSALDPDSWENAMHEFNSPWETAMHEFQSSSPSSRRVPPPPPPPRDGAQVAPAVQLRIEEQINDDYQPQYGQSIGAKGHGRGKCTPCTRILVRPGCEFGSRCMFCHLEHSEQMDSRKNRHRPCKAARQQHKQTIQKVYEEYKDSPEKKKKALEKIAGASPYMRSLLKSLGEKDEEEVIAHLAKADEALQAPKVPGLQPADDVKPSSASSEDPALKMSKGKVLISL